MKSGFLGAMAMLFAGAGWVAAQPPATPAAPGAPPTTAAPTIYGPAPNGPAYLPADAGPAGPSGPIFYSSAEYLLWKIKSGTLPQTATSVPVGLISVNTSDLFTLNPAFPGMATGTQTVGFAPVSITNQSVFGGSRSTDMGAQSGARLTFGWWGDSDQTWGVEFSGFFTERGEDDFAAISSTGGNQFLINTGFNRNLFLVQTIMGVPRQTLLNTFPVFVVRETRSSLTGEANATLFGAEVNARSVGLRIGNTDVAGLIGFRWVGYREELAIRNNVRLFRPAGFPITSGDASASLSSDLTFSTDDRLRIWNNFYGGQAGFDVDTRFGSFFLNTRVKMAVGAIVQQAYVNSTTQVINNDPVAVQPPSSTAAGGLLAGPNDVGSHQRSKFSWVPELNAKLGCQVTRWLRGWVGYDALYIGHVARTSNTSVINELNTNIAVAGSNQTIRVSQPTFRFRDQDLWVQGLNFGCEITY